MYRIFSPRFTFLALDAFSLTFSTAAPISAQDEPFRRGDLSDDGGVDLTDVIKILQSLFIGGETPACLKSGDVDDNGNIEITDGIRLLTHLFIGGSPPMPPYESCGADPTPDALT